MQNIWPDLPNYLPGLKGLPDEIQWAGPILIADLGHLRQWDRGSVCTDERDYMVLLLEPFDSPENLEDIRPYR